MTDLKKALDSIDTELAAAKDQLSRVQHDIEEQALDATTDDKARKAYEAMQRRQDKLRHLVERLTHARAQADEQYQAQLGDEERERVEQARKSLGRLRKKLMADAAGVDKDLRSLEKHTRSLDDRLREYRILAETAGMSNSILNFQWRFSRFYGWAIKSNAPMFYERLGLQLPQTNRHAKQLKDQLGEVL